MTHSKPANSKRNNLVTKLSSQPYYFTPNKAVLRSFSKEHLDKLPKLLKYILYRVVVLFIHTINNNVVYPYKQLCSLDN